MNRFSLFVLAIIPRLPQGDSQWYFCAFYIATRHLLSNNMEAASQPFLEAQSLFTPIYYLQKGNGGFLPTSVFPKIMGKLIVE